MAFAPGFTGIDLTQPIHLHIAPPQSPFPPVISMAFTVEDDGTIYLDNVGTMIPGGEDLGDGLHRFPMAPPETPGVPSLYIWLDGQRAVVTVTDNPDHARVPALPADTAARLAARPGPLSATIQTTALADLLRETLRAQTAQMAEIKAMMAESEDADPEVLASFDQMAAMMDLYQDLLPPALRQIALLDFNLDPASDLTLRADLAATPGTTLAAVLAAMNPSPDTVAGLAAPDALMSLYGTMAGLDHIIEPYADFLTRLLGSLGDEAASFSSDYRDMILAMKGLYTGPYSALLLPPSPSGVLQIAGIYAISDADQAREAFRRSMEFSAKSFYDADGGTQPVTVTITNLPSSERDGLTIEHYRIAYTFAEDGTQPMPEALTAMMTNLTYHVAYLDDLMLFSVGDATHLDRVIDHVRNPAPPQRTGFDDLPAGQDLGQWTLDLGAIVGQFAAALAPASDFTTAARDLSIRLRGLTLRDGATIASLTRLTRADLEGLVSLFGALQTLKPAPAAPSPEEEAAMREFLENLERFEEIPAP
jgi:hypothetical protein